MKKEDLRIVFMGTPEFAKCSLQALLDEKYNVIGVFCQPDRPSGRGMKLTPPPVKLLAESNNITVYQPEKIKNNEQVEEILKELDPNIIIVVAYGKILPKYILDYPKYGAINVHGSLLPKYRGAAPIQWSVINGDETTGITTMYMDEGMDTGNMLIKAEIEIKEDDTYGSMHDKLMVLGAETLSRTLQELIKNDGILKGIKQPNEYTLAPMIDKNMCKIDFNKSAKDIVNHIKGLNPVPTAWCKLDEERIYKVYGAEYITIEEIKELSNQDVEDNHDLGQIIYANDRKNIMAVKCLDGYVNLFDIKPKNSKRMLIGEYLRGKKLEVGEIFE